MSEKEDTYHDTILDLEAKLKKNVDLILKLGNSLQGMFMLGPKPLSVYDQQLKHGLGYSNPYTLKQAILKCPKLYVASSLGNLEIPFNVRDSEDTLKDAFKIYDQQLKHGLGYSNPYTLKQAILKCPKLYVASSLGNLEIPLNVRDSEDTLEDAFKSQQKMTEKMNDPIAVANKQNCWTINYKKLNALYKDFIPQKELSVEQKYFSSSSIPSVKIPVSKNMPSESPLIKELDKIKVCFEKLSLLIQQNCKRASIFYTSPAEIQINDFCQDQVKPILNELKVYLEFFRNLFQRDIKEMKDVFELTESELDELEKQNDLLKDQLLEASLKQDVELCVLINHECVDKILNVELEKVKKKSFEIQKGLQARIKILEKDVQGCEKQSISKMEKLEDENVSLDFKVQSLIKEHDNAKTEYKKLFDSIKKTRSQTQKEMDELIVYVSEKTYAYGAIRVENQNILSTIYELKTRLEKVEKGKSINTKFDKTNGYQSLLCVTPLNKHAFQKKTDVPKTEENHVVSKPVTLQTSPTKQTGANQNTNVIRPGMYRVVTTQESQTNKTKSALSSTGMNATSRVRRPMSRDSHVAHSVLDNFKKAAKNVAVYVRKNKQTDNTSANVISNKENVIDVDVANASKAKTLLCVSCMQNVLIPCHDKCVAKHKLNVLRMFSEKETQSKTLDTTSVVSKSKIDVESASIKLKAKGLGHNFWLGQIFVDDLEVAFFRSNTCYVQNLEGDDLLTGGRESNLYTISIYDMIYMGLFSSLEDELRGSQEFITQVQLNYNAKVCKICTDNGTNFKNTSLKAHYEKLGIMQQFSIARTPQQNGVVERRNRTLVEAARTMLIFSRLPEFLWAEAVATACFTQNRSIIHTRYNKTPYELLRGRKPNIAYFHVFGSLCYPTNDRDDLGKMKPKADIGVFIGYSKTSTGFQIYNQRTKMIMETIHVKFDELTTMASEHDCLEPELQRFNNHNSSAEPMNTPSKEDLDNLFVHEDSSSTSSIFVDAHEAPPVVTTSDEQTSPISLTEADEFNQEDSADFDGNAQFVPYNPPSREEIESSTTALEPSNVQNFHQVQPSTHIWTKDHPLDQVIGDPSKPVMTRQRLHTDSKVCMYALTVSTIEPKNIKEAMADHSWIESMQDELNQFERLQVWN
ncbi:retrovirus-related pol polyprotein from transposon TNT 1-94 [Tanacetum coccineum]